ncbi:helix-turn-helix domain-containing protein [Sphaerimonospora cavernae]|uniref:Helix-turn-helix domain-containing protein n=1 Tax=Sphaerimonospora cavernae TaxID=1740611 RepID=A0ABV6U039_9ACTN
MSGTNGGEPAEDAARLLRRGIDELRDLLGEQWSVQVEEAPGQAGDLGYDALIGIEGPDSHGSALMAAVPDPTPARLERELLPRVSLIRRFRPDAAAVVVAPWISPRAREMLSGWGCGYIDLTGNISFRMNRPAVMIQAQGATRDPRPRAIGQKRGLSGARAGRLVRALVDVQPPYRAGELTEATGLSPAYVSRLLDVLQEEGLIRRRGRGVVNVDWEALVRLRASETTLLKSGRFSGFLASNGTDRFLDWLRGQCELHAELAVTGPLAALQLAPVTIGGQVMLYASANVATNIANSRDLFSVAQGADVLLLQPPDMAVFVGRRGVDGLPHVALSQLALDCLSGPGRLPHTGEAVLDHMRSHEKTWRLPNLNALE